MGAPPFRHAVRFTFGLTLDAPILLSTRNWPVPKKKTGLEPVFFIVERSLSAAYAPLAA